jgi:hypothetical protein
MTIEGVADPDGLRDWLYARMRGARDEGAETPERAEPSDESLVLLREIRDALATIATEREVRR